MVEAALRILDDQGLSNLSMRQLAESLGVRPGALYWYFDSKQALLADVSRRILAPMYSATVEGDSLHERALRTGVQLRDCLLAYRDGAELVSSSLALGLVVSPVHTKLGIDQQKPEDQHPLVLTAAEAVTHFVVGFTFHEQQRTQAEALGVTGAADDITPQAVANSSPVQGGDFRSVLKLICYGLQTLEPSP